MDTLIPMAATLAERLKARGDTVAVGESSTGGLLAAALLAVPGASAYFTGGAVVYTVAARAGLLGLDATAMGDIRSASEPYAELLARTVRDRMGAVWGLAETGASGPSGNRYGDAAGHTCLAVAGPVTRVRTLETGDSDREANMRVFAQAALELLDEALREAG